MRNRDLATSDWIYYSENTLSAGAESYALFWFINGCTHAGIFIPSKLWKYGFVQKIVGLKIFPLFRIGINTATPEYSKRWFFQIMIFGLFFGISSIDGKPGIRIQRGLYNVW